jgi:arylformamidase
VQGRAPLFLILPVASRRDSNAQSEGLAAKLLAAGVEAMVVPAEGKTHATINGEFGQPDDPATKAVFEFLRGHCHKSSPK